MAKLTKLSTRAKLKGLSQYIAYSLYYTCTASNLRRSYRNSIYCQDVLIASDGVIKSTYCKNRWCPSCNRIKTAGYINRYLPVLEAQKELYFVTLTRPNVVADDLRAEIKELLRLYRYIVNNPTMRNLIKSTNTVGVRKLECTYNPQRDDYHPHLHLLVSSKSVSDAIVSKWLNLNPIASRDAQCVKPVSELYGGVKELFKYFTKLLARSNSGRVYFDAVHMDVVFVACRNVQIFGGLGGLKINDINDDEADGIDNVGVSGVYKYRDIGQYIGYYSIDEADNSNLIEVAKPRYLKELES